jgi:DNA-binding transcriptional ArsR family regulator
LKILKDCGLVMDRKDGNKRLYSITDRRIFEITDAATLELMDDISKRIVEQLVY